MIGSSMIVPIPLLIVLGKFGWFESRQISTQQQISATTTYSISNITKY